MPGPPRGPSYRITSTSPFLYFFASTAAKPAPSLSKQRAVPRNLSSMPCMPATLQIAPCGARLPLSTTRPPVFAIGFLVERTTSWSLGTIAPFKFSAMVLPVAAVEQRLQQHRHATDAVQVVHHVFAARLEV